MTAPAQPATYSIDIYHGGMRRSWRWKCRHEQCGENHGGYRKAEAATAAAEFHTRAHAPDEAIIGQVPGDAPPPAPGG
jgi:hypothetical protein